MVSEISTQSFLMIFSAVVSFIVTLRGLPVIIAVAHKKKLVDEPESRKIHSKPIASLGGIAIFAGFFMGLCMLWPEVSDGTLSSIVAASLIIFFLGVKDDIVGVSASRKFIAQVIAAGIIVFKLNLEVTSFYGLFGLYQIPPALVIVFSMLTIIFIINAFNLIDGVDSLCALFGILCMATFGLFFFWAGVHTYAVISFSMLGSLIAFLIYNLPPARIFMGDTGSLLLGLISSILAIKFIEVAGSDRFRDIMLPSSAPILAMVILFVPLFDAIRVFTLRLFSGKSPFTAEKNHVHHLLLRRGWTHGRLSICLVLFNLALIVITWKLRFTHGAKLLTLLFSLGTLGIYLAQRTKPVSKKMVPFPLTDSKEVPVSSLKELNAEFEPVPDLAEVSMIQDSRKRIGTTK
ncbi:MAG TPA: MraY family glycosyltransferase [Oligoflexia bacterium]|nr:MraY family glycosyltransferase [Oligoflexia bacterium]HMP48549.1 MraY family glycosyltransferase [Oligoflexia bacterium]